MIDPTTSSPRVVLITGCDTGIGRALAQAFKLQGLLVVATGLSLESMGDLAEKGIRTFPLDVTQKTDMDALLEQLRLAEITVDILVNNAGYGAMGPVVEMLISDAKHQYEVNVFGLLSVTQAFAQSMITRRRGTIVNIGSTSGILTSPFAGVYCSTKAAVHALNDAMRMELAPFGIDVVRVEPNQIRTTFGDTAASGLLARFPAESHYLSVKDAAIARAQSSQTADAMSAEEFATRVANAILAPKPPVRLRLGRQLWPYTLFKPFLPSRIIDRLLMKRFALNRLGRD